ncbi:MAG: RIP metalloprotease RseP [Desulfobacca sp.]|uniref:RIP metalloprotease RseP n=1 Tax=Desulfobacca sp. TaxID=2067990 RepID=UPI0040495329
METILATLVVIGVLIFVHELGHFLVAKYYGVGVEAFSLGFPPKLISKKVGETDYRISIIPLGGYVKLLGENPGEEVPPALVPRSFSHRPLGQRTAIVAAGPLFNLLFAIVALSLVFTFTGIPYFQAEIGGIQPGSPAEAAGLQKGDLVLSINGQQVNRWEDLSRLIRASEDEPLAIRLRRGGQELEVQLQPQTMETTNIFGEKVYAKLIGVSAPERYEIERVDPISAWWHGLTYSYRILEVTVVSIGKLITQKVPLNSLGGPIMIAQVAGKQAEQGVSQLIHFMAVLSINLALLNILPIPMLDGGHLLFFLFEAVRGKPVSLKHREIAQAIGLTALLTLMFVVFYHDILRVLGGQ